MVHIPIRKVRAVVCLVFCSQLPSTPPSHAQPGPDRPVRIGLALSGGGALGAAHIGVLKVLEREGIQIDCIAASSFGAIIGGLYATGHSAEEVARIVTGSWYDVLSDHPERAKAPLVQAKSQRQLAHISLRGFNPTLPVGLLRGQWLLEIANRYTVEQMLAAEYDFDRLPVRFRAVATDLLTGRPYVFRSGRMSEAMRASSALPLIFTPWPKDGMLLVDGSMSNNLPADIVREMGADVVIAVDVTSPDARYEDIRNFLDVYEQCLGMVMRQTVRSHYRYADLVIRPDLSGYSNGSYARMGEIVLRGAEAADSFVSDLRARIGTRRAVNSAQTRDGDSGRIIDSVSVVASGGAHSEDRAPAHSVPKVASKPREAIKPDKLAVDTQMLYASGLFENVDYELRHVEENRYRLQYKVLESPSNTLGLSLRYATEYKLQGLAEFSSRGLFGTPSAATVSGRFGSAACQNAAVRLVHPKLPFAFLEPQVQWSRTERLRFRDHQDIAAFVDRRHAAQLALGTVWKGRFEASVGYRFETATFLPTGLRNSDAPNTRLAGVRLHARRDTLDAQEFPLTGMLFDLQADKRVIGLGSDLAHSVLRAGLERYFSLSDKASLGIRLAGAGSRGALPEYERAFLGGHGAMDSPSVRLIGFARDELNTSRFALAGAMLRWEVLSRPMSFARRGFITMEYNVARVTGQANTTSEVRTVQGAAVGFSLDTMIGPVRFAVGVGNPGRVRTYFTLGPSF